MFISHTVTFVKAIMAQVLGPDDIAVDATVGNGIDTLFLSRQVGPAGRIFGFDVQQEALDSAKDRLDKEGCMENVHLFWAGHERMADLLPSEVQGAVRAVMFNFGYLPGGNESVVTRPETSCAAINAALSVMDRGALCSMVLYTGHPGGMEEAQAVEAHCRSLPLDTARVMECQMINHPTSQTRVLFLERR